MKKLLKISFASLLVLAFSSCTDDKNELTGNSNEGGLLKVETGAVAFIQGAPGTDVYTADLSVFQGAEMTETVDVYKKFYHKDPITGVVSSSDNIILKSFNFPLLNQNETYQVGFTYGELIAGLSVNGTALPTDDAMLTIGDYWDLTYVARLTDGTTEHLNRGKTKVTVSCGSFLAGDYVWGTTPVTVTALGGGLYSASYLPRFASVYSWQFSDVCGDLTITTWQFQASNPISGTTTPMPHGVVNANGSLTFSGVNVAGVSWYVDSTWTITPN